MSKLVVTSRVLANIVKQITQGLLGRRFKKRAKCYIKIDFQILDQDEFFSIQITNCSSGYPELKNIFTDAIKNEFDIQKLDENQIVARVEEKSANIIKNQKIIYSGNSSFNIIDDEVVSVQKEFSLIKCYISIKLLFQAIDSDLHSFSTFLLNYFKEIEQIDANIKLLFRKDKQYIYRNHVRMDDIVLSCKILSSSCTRIFQNSQNDDFQNELMNLINIKNPNHFEEIVGCLLLAQVNNNFKGPIVNTQSNSLI